MSELWEGYAKVPTPREMRAVKDRQAASELAAPPLLSAPRQFLTDVDGLLSWVANRGWVIRDPEDRELAQKLIRQARGIYEGSDNARGEQQPPGQKT